MAHAKLGGIRGREVFGVGVKTSQESYSDTKYTEANIPEI